MARKSNNQRIISAYVRTVYYFQTNNALSFVYQLFYNQMNANNADEIREHIDYLREINPDSYSESYSYAVALDFFDAVNTVNPNLINYAIDGVLSVDDELAEKLLGVTDILASAYEEYRGDLYSDTPSLDAICEFNRAIIYEAASCFIEKYEESLMI